MKNKEIAKINSKEIKLQKITLKLQKTQIIQIDLQESDNLGEIIPILSQHPYLLLHPNFVLYSNKTKIQAYQSVASQTLNSKDPIVDIKFKGFDSYTAKQHIINCAQFFLKPNSWLYEKFLEFNIIIGKVDYLSNMLFNQKLKIDERKIDDLVEGNMTIFKQIDFLSSELEENKESLNFFKKLKYSEYNPPMGEARLQGDLIYLELDTLCGKNIFLTLNKNGCFQNSSTEDNFNRKPSSNCYFSLFELLSELSPIFKSQISKFYDPLNQDLILKHSEQYKIMNTEQLKEQFFYLNRTITKRDRFLHSLITILQPDTYGFNSTLYRDWNEEFQNLTKMPQDTVLAQVQKIKLLSKSQQNFIQVAKQLAIAINQNNIQPLNPSDNKSQNCYVFNNLFATYAVDSKKWELPKTETSPSTYSTVNNDLKNLEVLYNLNIENVNTINTCSIDFLGQRLVIQTVIQGILHFDQATWNLYGSIDDGKTMCFNENFHQIMEKVCDKFGISLNRKFQDQEGKEYIFHGSPEVKGIKAGDGREYLMDLMRLSPRDANYEDYIDYECCTLRPELVRNYLFFVNLQKQYQNQYKKIQEEKLKNQAQLKEKQLNKEYKRIQKDENQEIQEKVVDTKQKQEQSKEDIAKTKVSQQKEVIKIMENQQEQKKEEKQEIKKDLKPEKQKLKEFPSSFNTSLLSSLQSKNEDSAKEKENLKILAKYLKQDVIPAFVKRMSTDPLKNPVDQESLIKQLHECGINLRYLGYIYDLSVKSQNIFLQQLIQRTIFVRSVRKYLREIAYNENQETYLNVIIQNLNMLLANNLMRKKLDQKISNYSKLKPIGDNSENQKGNFKKSKKNKKSKRKVKQTTTSSANKYMLVTVNQFFEMIKEIAKSRYEFASEQIQTYNDFNFLKSSKSKLCFLREISKSLGISFQQKQYNFEATEKNPEYPLKVKNISNYYPLIKSVKFHLDCLKYNNSTYDQLMQRKKYEDALSVLKSSQNMVLNSYGLYHEEFVKICKNIALVKFLQKKHDEAISVQLFAVKLNQKLHGLDHRNTAVSILELSNYLFDKKEFKAAVMYHSLALYIFDLIASEFNSNSLLCLHELQIMTQGQKDYQLSMKFMEQLLSRNAQLYGETSERLIYFLEKLAQLKSLQKDFEAASLLQARHFLILNRSFKRIQAKLIPQQVTNMKNKLKESENLKNYYLQERNKMRKNTKSK